MRKNSTYCRHELHEIEPIDPKTMEVTGQVYLDRVRHTGEGRVTGSGQRCHCSHWNRSKRLEGIICYARDHMLL